jgi:ribosome-associated heat shock protein Hsp15
MSANDRKDGKVRIDKWLWAVRAFKTRSLAGQACDAGTVKINGRALKPSRTVGPGEVISVRQPGLTRTLRVREVVEKRVGAARVPEFMEDLTPASEYERLREQGAMRDPFMRSKGMGRPTKRERRILDALRGMGER